MGESLLGDLAGIWLFANFALAISCVYGLILLRVRPAELQGAVTATRIGFRISILAGGLLALARVLAELAVFLV